MMGARSGKTTLPGVLLYIKRSDAYQIGPTLVASMNFLPAANQTNSGNCATNSSNSICLWKQKVWGILILKKEK